METDNMCQTCSKTFKTNASLNNHRRIYSQPCPCPQCGAPVRQCYLKAHIEKEHVDDKSHTCNVCDKSFNKISLLKTHYLTHSKDAAWESIKGSYSYQICDKELETSVAWKTHLGSHIKQFSCPYCSKCFDQQKHVNSHVSFVHSREKPHTCELCGKGYSTGTTLRKHFFSHLKSMDPDKKPATLKTFHCTQCDHSFKRQSGLKTHIRNVHIGVKAFSCDICGKSISQKSGLKKHLRLHTNEKPFECTICKRSFSQKASLLAHYRAHTGDRPFQCSICFKWFKSSENVKSHTKNVHEEKACYECSDCPKTFVTACSLKRHRYVHSGTSRYTCELCSKSFTQSTVLKKHLLIHTREITYDCDRCSKIFNTRDGMKTHQKRVHTDERPFSCEDCERVFATNGEMRRHHKHAHAKIKYSSPCELDTTEISQHY